jgi:hypothetical protein
MTHLDEGLLHAYLDGELSGERPEVEQHLADCGECRERLQAARRLREQAREILGAAGPTNLSAPPFERVLQRARGQGRRARTPASVILAWAASLAVAVTAGWYARGLLVTRAVSPAAELARAPAVAAQPPAPAAPATKRPEVPAGNLPVADRAQRPSSTVVAAAAAEKVGAATGTIGEQVNAAPAPAAAAKLVVAQEAAPEPAERAARARAQLASPVVLNPAGWTAVNQRAAEERLGGPIATVPDLPLLGYAVSGTGPTTVVRTIQVLGAGATVELYQRRAGAPMKSAAAAAAPGSGTASLTVSWEGYSVTGTAPVPADSLRRLLARLSHP